MYTVNILVNDYQLINDLIAWCYSNVARCGRGYRPPQEGFVAGWTDKKTLRFQFDNEEDAVLFKLTWG